MEQRNGILSLFPVKKPILGMIHLKGEGVRPPAWVVTCPSGRPRRLSR